MHFYLSARPAPGFPPCRVHSCFPLKESCSTQLHFGVSDSLRPRGPEPARLLCPWDLPIKTTGVACHARLKTLCVVHLLSGFPGGLDGKESTCNSGDPGSIPGPRGSPEEGNGNPLQYSHGQRSLPEPVAKSRTPLSDWHLLTSAIRTSQVVQWYAGDAGSIPGSGMEEEVVATPVFLLGKSHEQRSLEGYSPVCDSGRKRV